MARAEASQATGSSLGPLDGVPVSVKDILDVRGMPTRHGSHLRPDTPKERDSPSVAQLREAGAVIFGKTTLSEMAHKATTDNPLAPVTPVPAPARAEIDSGADIWPVFTPFANQSGQPAASVSVGLAPSGLPIGVQIVGPQFAGALVLRVSALLEAELPKMPVPPHG